MSDLVFDNDGQNFLCRATPSAPSDAGEAPPTRSTVRCQKCGHTGVPSPTVVLDLESEIRDLTDQLTEARAERDALRAEPSEDDVQRACDVYSSWPNNPRVQAHADVRRRSLRAALVDFIARRTRSGRASSSEGGTSNG